ncbi:MAG: ribonuclease P protein component [Actinomycetota bacterium]
MIARVDRRRTFEGLRRDGRRVRHGSVRLNFLPLDTPAPQVAFALGRSFGNAVERNRGRRRLRAAFIEAFSAGGHAPGAYLLTGNRGLLTDRYDVLVADVGRCLDKLRPVPAL